MRNHLSCHPRSRAVLREYWPKVLKVRTERSEVSTKKARANTHDKKVDSSAQIIKTAKFEASYGDVLS